MTNPLPVGFLLDEYKDLSSEEVAHLYAEVVDRWTWDTGSEEDAKLMRKVGTEHRWRRDMERPKKKFDDTAKEFAADIAQEIDREVLRDLVNIADNMES